MDTQRPPKKHNVAIVAVPDGPDNVRPIEHGAGKILPKPAAIIGVPEEPTKVEEKKAESEPVVVEGDHCSFCKSTDIIHNVFGVHCNNCMKNEAR